MSVRMTATPLTSVYNAAFNDLMAVREPKQ